MMVSKSFLFVCSISLLLFSCKKDDESSCTSCSSPQTSTFEVCQNSNGNASVNGEDTGISFETYIAGLVEAGATCGGD